MSIQIKVKKLNLHNAIQFVFVAAGSGDDSAIHTHFLFCWRVASETLLVMAQNGKMLLAEAIVEDAEVTVDVADDVKEVSFTVPAWRLVKFLGAAKDEDTITLDHDGSSTRAKQPKGSGRFGSLDPNGPNGWPWWTDTYAAAKSTTKIASNRLADILAYSRNFVSDQEQRSPALCAMECKDGMLSATDSEAVGLVRSPTLANSEMRIHGKDVAAALSALAQCKEEEVTLLEHDRCLFIVRANGSYIGISRWIHQFPMMKNLNFASSATPKCSFTVKTADLTGAMDFLEAFAKKDYGYLHFRFNDGRIVVAMESGSGDPNGEEHTIDCVAHDSMDALAAAGHSEFRLSKKFVRTVASTFGEETIQFRVDVTQKNGYVSFYHDRDDDEYCTVIVWKRKD